MTAPSPWPRWTRWAGWVGGILGWALSDQLGSDLAQLNCQNAQPFTLALIGLAGLGVTAVGAVVAWRSWRGNMPTGAHPDPDPSLSLSPSPGPSPSPSLNLGPDTDPDADADRALKAGRGAGVDPFIAGTGLLAAGIFALAILFQTIAGFIIPPCHA